MPLPPDYLHYFTGDGPNEGALSVDPGWFVLWPPEEIESWNREYEVDQYAPGFLGFGSSGGGELLAIDAGGAVFMIPLIGMAVDAAVRVADSWSEFVERIEPDE